MLAFFPLKKAKDIISKNRTIYFRIWAIPKTLVKINSFVPIQSPNLHGQVVTCYYGGWEYESCLRTTFLLNCCKTCLL